MIQTMQDFQYFYPSPKYFIQGCGVGRFFRIPTPDSDSSSFEKPTPTPAVLKNRLTTPTPAFLKTRLRLQQL